MSPPFSANAHSAGGAAPGGRLKLVRRLRRRVAAAGGKGGGRRVDPVEAAGVCLRVKTAEALTRALTDWPGPGPEVIQAFFAAHSGATEKTLAALDAEVKTR